MRAARRSLIAAVALAAVAAGACAREPADAVCPAIGAGDLVVTEVRGPQDPDDAVNPWIELFNPGSSEIDLVGIRIRFRRKDGSSEVPVLVRRSLAIAPGGYAVLGLDDDGALPGHADYGFAGDFHASWLAAAAIDVDSCGTLIDRAIYDALPEVGTFALGATPPTADANDLPAAWCFDPAPAGTPRAANPACP